MTDGSDGKLGISLPAKAPTRKNGGMNPDNEARQELLRTFGGWVANWKKEGGKQGDSALHKASLLNLRLHLEEASARGDIDDTDLCQAGKISLEELRDIRDSLN